MSTTVAAGRAAGDLGAHRGLGGDRARRRGGVRRSAASADPDAGRVARSWRPLASLAGVYATRQGERRLGWIAVAIAVLGAILGVMAAKSGESNLERVFVWSALVAGMLRFATPLIFGAMGGILSERSGVINIGLEGMMLIGAFFGIFGSDLLGSWFLGVVGRVAAGALIGLVHAFVSIQLRADQVVSGTGINFLRSASPATSSSTTTATRARPPTSRAPRT